MNNDMFILIGLATEQLANEAEYLDNDVALKYGGHYTYAYVPHWKKTLKHLSKNFKDCEIGISADAILRVIEHYQNNGLERTD